MPNAPVTEASTTSLRRSSSTDILTSSTKKVSIRVIMSENVMSHLGAPPPPPFLFFLRAMPCFLVVLPHRVQHCRPCGGHWCRTNRHPPCVLWAADSLTAFPELFWGFLREKSPECLPSAFRAW